MFQVKHIEPQSNWQEAPDGQAVQQSQSGLIEYRRKRRCVVLACVAAVIVALAIGVGVGTGNAAQRPHFLIATGSSWFIVAFLPALRPPLLLVTGSS